MLHATIVGSSRSWIQDISDALLVNSEIQIGSCITDLEDIALINTGDAILVDYSLIAAGVNGEALRRLSLASGESVVIVVGVPDDPSLHLDMIQRGIAGIVVRGAPLEQLQRIVALAVDGIVVLNAHTVEHLIDAARGFDSPLESPV